MVLTGKLESKDVEVNDTILFVVNLFILTIFPPNPQGE